jgi:hybrid cluster-associated redox disulfide protein
MRKKARIGNEKVKAGKITKKMTFADVLKKHPETAEIFMQEGLYCIGCPMAMMETIEQGCGAHGIDPDKLVEKLNKKLQK